MKRQQPRYKAPQVIQPINLVPLHDWAEKASLDELLEALDKELADI